MIIARTIRTILIVMIAMSAWYSIAQAQSESQNALIRRAVFKTPLIWKLTKSVTNDLWGKDLFGYPRSTAQSYIMDPDHVLYSGVSFKLDHDWCRLLYTEVHGNWIRAYSSYGTGNCQLWAPKSIASLVPFNDEMGDSCHYVYVADTRNDRIVRQKYNWSLEQWTCVQPITDSHLSRPIDIDINENYDFWPHSNDYLWVLNSPGEIMRFTVDDGQLTNIFMEPGCDSQPFHLCRPTAIVSGRSYFLSGSYDQSANTDSFYIADAGNERIVLARKHGSNAVAWIRTTATTSTIVDLEVDIFGQLWAVDRENGTITKYRYDLFPLCTFGSSGIGENQFLEPISICNNGGYYLFGNMSVTESWSDSSGMQYFAIGTDILDFSINPTKNDHFLYINYTLIDPSHVTLQVYDQQGGLVRTIRDGNDFSGPCSYVWDGTDDSGQPVDAGDYRLALVDSCTYWNAETQAPVNVVTKEQWFHHAGYTPGDINGDGAPLIDISDLVYLVDYMFCEGPVPQPYSCVADVDASGDGVIDIADLVYLVDYMFVSGPPPLDGCRVWGA